MNYAESKSEITEQRNKEKVRSGGRKARKKLRVRGEGQIPWEREIKVSGRGQLPPRPPTPRPLSLPWNTLQQKATFRPTF